MAAAKDAPASPDVVAPSGLRWMVVIPAVSLPTEQASVVGPDGQEWTAKDGHVTPTAGALVNEAFAPAVDLMRLVTVGYLRVVEAPAAAQ